MPRPPRIIKLPCYKCGEEIERPYHRIKDRNHFCQKCSGTSVDLICPVCGKNFHRWTSQLKDFSSGQPRKKNCCSIKCKNIGLRSDWKDLNRRTLKQRWEKEFGTESLVCKRCGYDKKFNLIVHHKTYVINGGTNEPSNLEILCLNCHGEKHYGDKEADQPLKLSTQPELVREIK